MDKRCPFLKVTTTTSLSDTGSMITKESFGRCLQEDCPYYDFLATTEYCKRIKNQLKDLEED